MTRTEADFYEEIVARVEARMEQCMTVIEKEWSKHEDLGWSEEYHEARKELRVMAEMYLAIVKG